MTFSRNFKTVEGINKLISNLSEDKTIVYTYGAWDLLHPGHVSFIHKASMLGDFLIVATVSDGPIRKLKGSDRPIQCAADRAKVVSSLRFVDAGIIQKEYDPSEILLSLERVNILTKGDDWKNIPGQKTIEKLGGKLVKPKYTVGYSTSDTVSKMTGKPKKIAGEPK